MLRPFSCSAALAVCLAFQPAPLLRHHRGHRPRPASADDSAADAAGSLAARIAALRERDIAEDRTLAARWRDGDMVRKLVPLEPGLNGTALRLVTGGCAFSGDLAACGATDGTVHVVELTSGNTSAVLGERWLSEDGALPVEEPVPVAALAFDGDSVLAADATGLVSLWQHGRRFGGQSNLVGDIGRPHGLELLSLAFLGSGNAMSVGRDAACLWARGGLDEAAAVVAASDAAGGEDDAAIASAAFADGLLAVGLESGAVAVYSVDETCAAVECRVRFRGHDGTAVTAVAFSDDGGTGERRLYTGDASGNVNMWDLVDREDGSLQQFPFSRTAALKSRRAVYAFGSGDDGGGALGDAATRQRSAAASASPLAGVAALQCDGSKLVAGFRSGAVVAWRLRDGEELFSIPVSGAGEGYPLTRMQFDRNFLVTDGDPLGGLSVCYFGFDAESQG